MADISTVDTDKDRPKSRMFSSWLKTQGKECVHAWLRLVEGPDMDDRQRRYLSDWQERVGIESTDSFAVVVTPVYLVCALFVAFFAPRSLWQAGSFIFVLLAANTKTWSVLIQRASVTRRLKLAKVRFLTTYLIGSMAVSYIVFQSLRVTDFKLGDYFMVGLFWILFLWLILNAATINGLLTIPLMAFAVGETLVAYLMADPKGWHAVVPLILITSLFFAVFYLARIRRERSFALLDLARSDLIAENQSLKLKAIESELRLASALQQSSALPEESATGNSWRIDVHHVPHGILGGDWVATRSLPNGAWVVAVADVSGKGVPAALVVQAVQSLWAERLASPDFDPVIWIKDVNRTLFLLGQGETHTMTLGLLTLDQKSAVYFSAGHVPAYLVQDINDGATISEITGAGLPLGVRDQAEISQTRVLIRQDSPFVIMVGSDGVLDWRTRRKTRNVYKMMREVAADGSRALSRYETDDDKILVMVRGAACFGSAINEPAPTRGTTVATERYV